MLEVGEDIREEQSRRMSRGKEGEGETAKTIDDMTVVIPTLQLVRADLIRLSAGSL